jgi:hypothetical protein
MLGECRYCNAPSPRLYALPARIRPERRAAGPACYFCFIRATGIKPTRRQIVRAEQQGEAVG